LEILFLADVYKRNVTRGTFTTLHKVTSSPPYWL